MAVRCGTVTVLYCVTLYVGAVGNSACYGSAVWHSYSALLCDTVCFGAVGNWACYGSAVWHIYSAVLCDTVCWCCR